ncbi:ATPase, AAA family protein [Sporothrix schenckii 1099-18]|uniref:ATPase, AAA family protein n=1 Tax=Sporothrix schenckii 1099-18 TaxID=1397361 RepID=A0A0F2MGW6_SPOSC|nr:ATPase, AAA family protein [Sporothrix schenckii 1099-18]KJR88314.1 ATPase, AAA family protein [Sporothrix schenckii 1099-18]
MDSQNSAGLVIREMDTSTSTKEDTAKAIVDPVPASIKTETSLKKTTNRANGEGNASGKAKTSKAQTSNTKKPKRTVVIEVDGSSGSESDSDSSSLASDLSSDQDLSDSESSSSADEDSRKKKKNKKRRDAAKATKRGRSKKSKKPIKAQDLSDSDSDSNSDSDSDSSSVSRSSASRSSSDSESSSGSDSESDGFRHPARGRHNNRRQKDLARLMLLQQQQQQPPPPTIPAFNPYQQYQTPYYGAPMGMPMGGMAFGAGMAQPFATMPAYTPPPLPAHNPPPRHGMPPKRSTPPIRGRGRMARGMRGGMHNVIVDGHGNMRDNHRRRKSSKHRKTSKSMSFKRVDQVWDNTIHNYKLQDTAEESPDSEYDGYVFHVRRTFDWEGKYKQTFVDIKSNLLRDALQEVMGDIKGISLVEETPKMDPNLLFLYLEDIRKHIKTMKGFKPTGDKKTRKKEAKRNEKKRQQLKVLAKYLDKDYEELKNSLKPLLKNGLITFELLWALWKPNTLAFTTTYGSPDDPRVFKAEMAEKHFSISKGSFYYIEGKYFEYDGKRFGFGSVADEIDEFRGARKITSLPVYPLEYHKNEEQLRKDLIERGKKFVALSGVQYKNYDGMAYYKKKKTAVKVNISGRIMIDSSIHRRINPNYPISLIRPTELEAFSEDDNSDNEWGSGRGRCVGSDTDEGNGRSNGILQEKKAPEKLEKGPEKEGGAEDDNTSGDNDDAKVSLEFSEEEYLMSSPVVLGFAFAEKMWLEFTVSSVKDIHWNKDAYESLVLESKTKDIVKALVESHKYHAAESIDDVIQGKGKGLVAVLHGPPGTGKTLTAEGISELLKCPLYMVSAGELGTDSRFLESELQKILDICHAWGAILLLDEADVFLEKRNMHDIHRNALVSIFLRQLEYFQGILFLTTNRVETFDDAFQSRIHLALRYDILDQRAKKAIFKIFIERVRVLEKIEMMPFSDEDYNDLARNELNGRQIKNTVRTAQALAVNKKEPMSMSHIRQVLEVHMSFDRDLKGGPGFQDAMRSYF